MPTYRGGVGDECLRVLGAFGVVAVLACDSSTAVPRSTTYTIRLSPATVDLVLPPAAPTWITVTAAVLEGNDTTALPNARVEWTIDAPSIATVTASGTVTAVQPGTTTLHARFAGLEVSAPVTVTAPPLGSSAFARTGSMTRARTGHTATLLASGKVLIAGGADASAELYDPATGTFALTGSMTTGRSGHSATLLRDGRVLIAGGAADDSVSVSGSPALLKSAELYDPITGTFSRTGDMLQGQVWQTATLLTNGKVLLTGGDGDFSDCCSVVPAPELYDPATGTFSATGAYVPNSQLAADMQTWGLSTSTATLLRDGKVLVAAEPVAQVYDPASGTFALTGQMTTERYGVIPPYLAGQTATLLLDGRVFVAGGAQEDLGRFASTETYDPSTGRFAGGATMAIVRDEHTATLLADGKVLIVGGESVSDGCPPTCVISSTASAELYDPVTRTLTLAGSMNDGREWHRATLLNDGRVLITGGDTFIGGTGAGGGYSVTSLASAELYVPVGR